MYPGGTVDLAFASKARCHAFKPISELIVYHSINDSSNNKIIYVTKFLSSC